jgi:translation elongation factor EF-4
MAVQVTEVGLMRLNEQPVTKLYAGQVCYQKLLCSCSPIVVCLQVGFVTMGLKTRLNSSVGDTLFHTHDPVEPLPGFRPSFPMVFAGLFPVDQVNSTGFH